MVKAVFGIVEKNKKECENLNEKQARRIRLEIIVAMLNDDPKLREQIGIYLK